MGVSPLRLAAALAFGGMVTGSLYLTQHANGLTLPAAVTPAQAAVAAKPQPTARPTAVRSPAKSNAPQAVVPLAAAPRRIVLKNPGPGDVVLSVRGDELQVQFVPVPKPAAAKPAKISALPVKATPVATP